MIRLFTGGKCQNDCFFCDRKKKKNPIISGLKNRIDAVLKNNPNDESITFFGGDPLLRNNFFDLMRYVKRKNFKIIQVETNGRKLSDKKFAKKIINSGVTHFKISLYSLNCSVHDKITGRIGSFRESLKGLNNLIDLGSQKNIVINIVLTNQNIKGINYLIKKFTKKGIKKFQLNIVDSKKGYSLIPLNKIASFASAIRYDFIDKALIKIKGLPYCLIPEPEGLILKSQSKNFIKTPDCQDCKFFSDCNGLPKFYYSKKNLKKLIPQRLPEEVAIELSSSQDSPLNTKAIKDIINQAKSLGVSIVRFIVIESLSRKDIYELFKYAKERNLEVRLDISNIFVRNIKSLAERIVNLVDYVITYVDCKDIKKPEKKQEILSLKQAGIKTVRVITLANPLNVRNIEKIYRFLLKCKANKWAVNRDVYKKNIASQEIKRLVEKLVKIKKDIIKNKFSLRVHIVYAIPFCSYDPIKINFVCTGAKSIDGYERLLIDAQGIAKPIHYFNKKVGDFRDITRAWNSPFMKSIRFYQLLPNDCQNCFFLEKCKGGSRFCAYQSFGSYQAVDPLMDYSKVKNYIW